MSFRSPHDKALCLHEAAHAVTAEALRPGCVRGIQLDYVPGTPDYVWGQVFGSGVDALCFWDLWSSDDPDNYVAIAAGREGEKLTHDIGVRLDHGDRTLLRGIATAADRRRARRRAAAIVRKHSLAIRRVAAAAAERRWLTGDEIRELIA